MICKIQEQIKLMFLELVECAFTFIYVKVNYKIINNVFS